MVVSRGQQEVYMKITHLLLYSIAVLLRLRQCCPLCSLDTVSLVKTLLEHLYKGCSDSKLYTPRDTDYKDCYDGKLYTPLDTDYEDCSKSIMNCFAVETNVLIIETKYIYGKYNLSKMLENLTDRLHDKPNTCPQCEVYSEKNATTFLNSLLNYLEKINSSACK